MNDLMLLDGIERAQQRLSLQPLVVTNIPLSTTVYTKVFDITGAGVIENLTIYHGSLPPLPVDMKFVVDGVTIQVGIVNKTIQNQPGFFFERTPDPTGYFSLRCTPLSALDTRTSRALNICFSKSFQCLVIAWSGTPTTGVGFYTDYSLYK